MPRHWFLVLLPFILVFPFTRAQCTNECPTGGIWGEWSTTQSCATTCGACSNRTYTRICLSTEMDGGCDCVGSSTIIMPCGTQACNYPRKNGAGVICCIGTPMIIDNWYHCGPLPSNASQPCCPDGGYWSKWGIWEKKVDRIQWTRSRTCLSGNLACSCTGSTIDVTYSCPCTPIKAITTETIPCVPNKKSFMPRTPVFQAGRCVNSVIFEASNFRQPFHSFNGTNYVTTVGWYDSTGTCHSATISIGGAGTAGSFNKIDFPCRLNTMRFGGRLGGVDMENLDSIAQFY